MTSYDSIFFDYVNAGSLRSARNVLPKVLERFKISNVLDVGCGQGAWLAIWSDLGVSDVTGVDGDYVERSHLLIPEESFVPHDLSKDLHLDRTYDLVQSLEVAEHLPASSAAGFVASLVRHGDLVMFSAAPKGQGGDGHINEQNYNYWRCLFAEHGYTPVDFLRPLLINIKEIEPWYRFNTILYVSSKRIPMLSTEIKEHIVEESNGITDISPPVYKLRKLLVSLLPVSVMTAIAKLKERYILRRIQKTT